MKLHYNGEIIEVIKCPACQGSGKGLSTSTSGKPDCQTCKGTGNIGRAFRPSYWVKSGLSR